MTLVLSQEKIEGKDAYLISVQYTFDLMTIPRSPSQPVCVGFYANMEPQAWLPHVWEPDLPWYVKPDTRCRKRLGINHCSLEQGHGGLHHSEKVGVWWSDD